MCAAEPESSLRHKEVSMIMIPSSFKILTFYPLCGFALILILKVQHCNIVSLLMTEFSGSPFILYPNSCLTFVTLISAQVTAVHTLHLASL